MSSWQETTGGVSYTEWVRSWRQNIDCPLGSPALPPVLTAWIETVRVYSDGKVEKTRWDRPITITMSELTGGELTQAIAIQTSLTDIIGARVDAILNPPVTPPVEPDPEPPPE